MIAKTMRPLGWPAIGGAGLLAIVTDAWCVFANVPTVVSSTGVISTGLSVAELTEPWVGTV